MVWLEARLKNGIERLLFFPMRLRYRARARDKRKARIETLDAAKRTLSHATEIRAEKIKRVYNVIVYMLLVDQDLADFTDSIIFATSDGKRAFFAKHEAVLLYEAADDLRQLVGHDFRAAIRTFGTTGEPFSEVNAACSAVNKFWEEHRQFLNPIRNALAAHREHDALRYEAALAEIKPLEVMKRAAEFSQCLEQLVIALTPILSRTGDYKVILQDAISSASDRQP